APASLMRRSSSLTSSSQIPYPHGRMTIVPRTGPLSAISAPATTSWYQRGKSASRDTIAPLVMAAQVTGLFGGALHGSFVRGDDVVGEPGDVVDVLALRPSHRDRDRGRRDAEFLQ